MIHNSDFTDNESVINEGMKARPAGTFIPDEFSAGMTATAEKKLVNTEGFQKGISLFNMKEWENALRELLLINAASFSGDEQVELAYYLGLCCAKLERDDAPLYLEQVIAASADMLRVYQCRMALAYVYVKTGRARMAEFELKRLQRAGFESVSMYNTLAYAAYIQNRPKNAVELYEKSLDIDENNTTALNCMGYILADAGLDIKKGLRLCRKAVEYSPENPAYLDSLGWACYKSGDFQEARKHMRRALDLAPEEREIRKHYAIVTGEAG